MTSEQEKEVLRKLRTIDVQSFLAMMLAALTFVLVAFPVVLK